MNIQLSLNGETVTLLIDPGEFLLDVLRRNGCPSVRRGCDTGSCGTCTVLLDGTPVLSCSLLAAKTAGRRIQTAEGMQAELAELAEFLTAEGAEQCGYCSPGLALTILALKKEQPDADEAAIKHYLSGNLCRCSGYVGQLRAVKRFLGVT